LHKIYEYDVDDEIFELTMLENRVCRGPRFLKGFSYSCFQYFLEISNIFSSKLTPGFGKCSHFSLTVKNLLILFIQPRGVYLPVLKKTPFFFFFETTPQLTSGISKKTFFSPRNIASKPYDKALKPHNSLSVFNLVHRGKTQTTKFSSNVIHC